MSLFRKYGESLIDFEPGLEKAEERRKKESDIHGSLQQEKTYQRVARRAYRQSMRSGNYGGAMKALDWIDGKSGGLDQGIMSEGVRMDNARNQPGNGSASTQQGDPGLMGPPVPTPGQQDNLDMRLGLFADMTNSLAVGGDINAFRGRAAQLGVDDKHFGFGADRAKQEVRTREAATTDSPSLTARLTAFGGRKPSLFTNYA